MQAFVTVLTTATIVANQSSSIPTTAASPITTLSPMIKDAPSITPNIKAPQESAKFVPLHCTTLGPIGGEACLLEEEDNFNPAAATYMAEEATESHMTKAFAALAKLRLNSPAPTNSDGVVDPSALLGAYVPVATNPVVSSVIAHAASLQGIVVPGLGGASKTGAETSRSGSNGAAATATGAGDQSDTANVNAAGKRSEHGGLFEVLVGGFVAGLAFAL